MRGKLPLLVVLLGAAPALAVDVRGQGHVWVGPGLDTNARRDYTTLGVPTQPDLFAFLLASFDGQLASETWQATGGYEFGGRKFLFCTFIGDCGSEDTLVQSLQLEGLKYLGKSVSLGVGLRARDRRGAERDYTDLGAEAVLEYAPDEHVDVRLRGGPHRFLFYNRFAYSFFGPDASLSARYRFNRRHSVELFGNANPRTYNAVANADPKEVDPPNPAPTRTDFLMQVGAAYTYRGSWQFSASYTYLDEASNSFGETMRRHRLSVLAGFRLPARFLVLATATLQLTQFPDGVYLSPDLQVVEDDENSSSVTLKIVRPLSEHVDLDLRYALYVNVLPANNFLYFRQVATFGVSVNF